LKHSVFRAGTAARANLKRRRRGAAVSARRCVTATALGRWYATCSDAGRTHPREHGVVDATRRNRPTRKGVFIMTMIRWNAPSRSLVRVHDDWDRWFDGFFDGRGAGRDLPSLFAPPVDIDETAEAFLLRVDLPGVSP